MIGFAYVSPRQVLKAAPWRVRVQFWVLVGAAVGIASVPVGAGGEGVKAVEWFSWPVLSSVILLVFNLGITWQQLNDVKRRLGDLEEARGDYARKDVVVVELRALRDLLERR